MTIDKDFVAGIRDAKDYTDDAALRMSLQTIGWNKHLPAIRDEHGVLLVGSRRMKIAQEEGIEPVVVIVTFGDGEQADIERRQVAVVSNVGAASLSGTDRKRIAAQLYATGMTQEAISKSMGVSQATISNDLATLLTPNKVPDRVDRHGRKNTGRPKGSGAKAKPTKSKPAPKPAPVKARDDKGRVAGVDIKVDPNVWREFNDKAREENKSATAKIAELVTNEVQPPVDPSTLSLTAQQKLDLAIRQATRKLEAEIEKRVRDEVNHWLNDDLMPMYRKKEAHYNIVITQRKGIMKRADYRSVLSCLHPDRVQDTAVKKRYEHAFNLFTRLEKLLLDERESPTTLSDLPKTREELLKRKAEYDAQRAAERAKRKSANGVTRR